MNVVLDLLRQEAADEDFDLLPKVTNLAERDGWGHLLEDALEILADTAQQDLWRSATCVIYWAGPRAEMPIPRMAVVARLYWCLCQFPGFGGEGLSDGENLVWSVAIGLKGVRYESEWDPQSDPEVIRYLAEMG